MMDESDNFNVYRFWTHFFTSDDVKMILEPKGFENIVCFDDVLPDIDMWNGENVLFCRATKVVEEMDA
ncbi:hypothetical protein V7O66_03530 [Methanolobus sp. ZRKC3]|uniref:hypothetical protein n=1 Tax=Methanolobus sp. ZRKC3 TaxID=3125786 RepID=UPI0032515F80